MTLLIVLPRRGRGKKPSTQRESNPRPQEILVPAIEVKIKVWKLCRWPKMKAISKPDL